MTDAQRRLFGTAAWLGALAGAPVLVLAFVLREYSYRFHPDLIHALMYPVPAVVVVALGAAVPVAGGLVYACVEAKDRSRRILAGITLALLPPVMLVLAWLWWWD